MVAEETNTALLGKRFGDAVLAEQNGFGLGGVDDHADDDVGLFRRFRRRPGALAAIGHEPLTASAETSQPVTSNPARLSEVAMPKPIEPSPITAMRGFADAGHAAFP